MTSIFVISHKDGISIFQQIRLRHFSKIISIRRCNHPIKDITRIVMHFYANVFLILGERIAILNNLLRINKMTKQNSLSLYFSLLRLNVFLNRQAHNCVIAKFIVRMCIKCNQFTPTLNKTAKITNAFLIFHLKKSSIVTTQ